LVRGSVRFVGLRWLEDASERSIRRAVAAVAPEWSSLHITAVTRITTSNEEWCTGTAIVGGLFLVKFAWSRPAAVRVLREAQMLAALADAAPELPIPRLVGLSDDPVAFVSELVGGVPLAENMLPSWTAVTEGLATFLARLHSPAVLSRVQTQLPALYADAAG
jgi:hypothetical protein